jgi:hypothetical protein
MNLKSAEFWYGVLKVSSFVATGLFAALGLLTRYRDDHGRITTWGKTALAGIVLSSGSSLLLYGLEASRAKASALAAKAQAEAVAFKLETISKTAESTVVEQKSSLKQMKGLESGLAETLRQQGLNLERSDYIAKGMEASLSAQRRVLKTNATILGGVSTTLKKQEVVLKEVNRSINIIQKVESAWSLEIVLNETSLVDEESKRELEELKAQLDGYVSEIERNPEHRTKCGTALKMGKDGKAVRIRLSGSCMRWDDQVVDFLLNATMRVGFSHDPRILQPSTEFLSVIDFRFNFRIARETSTSSTVRVSRHQFEYDPQKKSLIIATFRQPVTDLRTNEMITAVPDLENAYLYVAPIYGSLPSDAEARADIERLLPLLRFRSLLLVVNHQSFLIDTRFERGIHNDKKTYFYTRLPPSLSELRIDVRKMVDSKP